MKAESTQVQMKKNERVGGQAALPLRNCIFIVPVLIHGKCILSSFQEVRMDLVPDKTLLRKSRDQGRNIVTDRIRNVRKILTNLYDDLRFSPPAINQFPDNFSAPVESERHTGITIYEHDIVIKSRAGEHCRILDGFIIRPDITIHDNHTFQVGFIRIKSTIYSKGRHV